MENCEDFMRHDELKSVLIAFTIRLDGCRADGHFDGLRNCQRNLLIFCGETDRPEYRWT